MNKYWPRQKMKYQLVRKAAAEEMKIREAGKRFEAESGKPIEYTFNDYLRVCLNTKKPKLT